VVETICDHSP